MDDPTARARGWTRRRVLAAGLAAAGMVAVGGVGSFVALGGHPNASGDAAPASAGERRRFRSRPDLTAPAVLVAKSSGSVASGYVFFTPGNGQGPDAPMIVDGRGEPVWIRPRGSESAANLRAATYRGAPVLTWWEGAVNGGYGFGEYVVADATYRTIARIRAGNGSHADLHELQLTPEGTALMTAVNGTLKDVPKIQGAAKPSPSAAAGSSAGPLLPSPSPTPSQSAAVTPPPSAAHPLWQNVVQEVDVESGEVLLDWHATDHIDPSESYLPLPSSGVYDFLHANSIDVDTDGNLLLSARHTFAVYKIDRRSGRILWRMGGKQSDFAFSDGARYAWQHDARHHPDGTLTLFDDEAAPGRSRGMTLRVDTGSRTVSLARQYVHPLGLLATSQGSTQVLPNGNVFVGWGAQPYFSEFGPDGSLLYDASFPAAKMSYRAFRFDWTGRLAETPALAVEQVAGAGVRAFMSWNGATEVARWELLAGDRPEDLLPAGSGDRSGFETAITAATRARLYAARALDGDSRAMATSPAVAIGEVTPVPSSPSASPSPSAA